MANLLIRHVSTTPESISGVRDKTHFFGGSSALRADVAHGVSVYKVLGRGNVIRDGSTGLVMPFAVHLLLSYSLDDRYPKTWD